MISKHDLQRWIDFLYAQIAGFDAAHLIVKGEQHVANETLVAFLKTNDAIVKDTVEQAVNEFAKTKKWPALNGDQLVNLTHRASSARAFLLAVLDGQVPKTVSLQIPNPNDQSKFVRWLLIDLWRLGGAAYMDGLTNDYFAEHRLGNRPKAEFS